jgi:hypothetical protein
MEFVLKDIPKIGRSKYCSTSSTTYKSDGSSSSGKSGLPYTINADGNYVIDNNIIIKGDVLSEGDITAFQISNAEYVGTYALAAHTHTIANITGLQAALNAAGTGVTSVYN